MKLKRIANYLSTTFVIFSISYLLTAFVVWDIDASHWSTDARYLATISGGFAAYYWQI